MFMDIFIEKEENLAKIEAENIIKKMKRRIT